MELFSKGRQLFRCDMRGDCHTDSHRVSSKLIDHLPALIFIRPDRVAYQECHHDQTRTEHQSNNERL